MTNFCKVLSSVPFLSTVTLPSPILPLSTNQLCSSTHECAPESTSIPLVLRAETQRFAYSTYFCTYECMSVTGCQIDVGLVVDHSGAITDDNAGNWNDYIIPFLQNLVVDLNVSQDGIHVGAVSYGRRRSVKLD